ncbi:autotransporter outer membrane beta-barrel domain-containing protein [Salmonella enterica subsp. enterica serovar 3,10:e,h:-]|nr:autotransporter outer membrane beta-barrel domain-containing protein [Salmonella enterica subsp. enterica serovar Meleagridis]EBA5811188.1 autotransporter outer membrane beta-barrel domain-containing protein [Salmonella enterica subsp. enterica serovar Meleagridis]EBJ7217299.1 autotransporter outer membrane beta-barrel domain-containing protein [Salmonella enterica subsp. enterica serovar 3,10:e,h:-]EEJ6647007.1 autotransporter outer membrane beta-barrel domain-containing protein [Salmonella 
MNKTYNIIWNAARGMYIVTSELARSGSRAIVSVSASCAVTLLVMDAAPAVAEETRVSIPSQTTTYTLSGATPFVVETGNTVATDIATSAAIVGDNSNDWDLLIESGAVVGSSLTDSQAMNLDSSTGATSVHNQGTITGSNEDGTIMLQNGGSVINDARIENNATYEHDPQDIPQEYAGVYMLNGGSYVSSESGVLEGVSGVIVQSGEAHITNGGMINSDGSWRSYGVEFRDGTYGTIVNTGTIITTASDGSGKIEDAAIYVHTLNDMAVSGSVSVDNSGLMQSDFITVALYYGSHFEVVNRVGGVITAGNSSLVGIKSTAMELKVGVDNLVTNDGTISAYGTANTYGIHYGESTSGGVITNTGSITTTGGGAGDASVYVHGNGDGTVVNNSGTMSSTVYGVYLDSARSKGHTLNNQAGGVISANTAVAVNGNGNTITNQGKMTGVSDGLLISGNNNIVTTSGGEISGKNGIRVSKGSGNQITAKSGSKITTTSTGISIAGGNNQITTESGSAIVAKDNGILINSGANNVTNGGSITATGSSISYGIQYNSGASGTITNTGTITTTGKGAGDASVYAHGGAVTINNSGTMDSSVFGVYVTTGHTLNNLAGGSISANTAVQFHGNNNKLANAGAILGDTNGVTINGSGNTLTSQGKITGGINAILINSGSKNNTLTLNTGTEISGSITDDNNSASANNNLILDGEGSLGSSISGLNSVTSSGDWTLSGATMNLSGTTNSALWVKSGTLIVNGAMTAKGATVDSGTTLQIGNGGTLGAFNGDIVDNGTLTFNRSDAAAYGSVISGSGNVVKQGGGELTLSNNNSYSGGTTIAEGTLTATAGGALGSGNIDNRAYLKLDAASASDPFIVADLTTHSGATVEIGAGSTLQANTLTQQDGSTLTADLTETSGPAIRAKNVNLDGTLNVASPASQEPIRSTDDLISLALIESDNAISGDFDDITINGNAMNPDAFITVVGQKNVNDTHYDLVETLTWYADRDNAAIDAHGTFNLADADDSFTVNTVLENVDANSGWNGQSLTKTGAGTLILNAENTYTGGTTISDGTLIANNVEALGTGNVTDNATLELNTGGDFNNNISGSGQVVKSGDKTLTLSGANSYSGATTISGGTLIATHVNALGTGAIDNRASLLLDASGQFTVTDLTTESGGNTEIGAGSTLQATTLTQKSDSTLTINLNSNTVDPVIHAASQVSLAGTLDITGVGDVLDSDPASTDDLDTFTLIASDKTIAGDFEKLTVAGMDADLADFITVDGRIDDTGKQYELTTVLTWYADRDDAVTDAHGTFNLTNADGSFAVNTVLENVDATLDPASATGWDGTSLIKQGAGTLILNAENTYTGGTTISDGTLVATNVDALGSGDVTDDATLELNTGGTFDNAISGSGQVVKSGDETLTLSGTNTYSGGTLISGGTLVASNVEALGTGDVTDNAVLELNTGGDFDNAISGSGQVEKSGDGTLTLSGSNTYTGGTTINDGTLIATSVDALGSGDVTDNATLALNTGGTFDNTISGSGKVEKSGDDALTLSGANSYTGGTLISGGTLIASNVEALGTGDVTNNATLELNTGGDFTNNISGSGQVVKSGDETLTLSGSNTYTGGTTINDGTLVATSVDALGSGDVTDNATLALNTGGTFDNTISGSGKVEKSGDDALTLSGANSYTGGTLISGGTLVASNVEALGSGDVTDNATLALNTGGTFDNTISGSGQVVKSGDDVLTLSGSNTYTGGTTISGGTLIASNVDALGTGDVTNDATLELNTGGDFTNNISGNGQVVKSGDDTLTFSGSNTYTGGTLISSGTLVANDVNALGTGDVTDNATLELNTGGDFTNNISGSGQVVKSGDDTLTLSGTNSYTGGTTISGGTLVATNVEALGTGDVTNNATLELNTGGDFTNNISGSGQVVKSGDETLTLSGANSYTGGTLISSGTLVANDVNALGTGDVTDNAVLELNTGGDFDNAISGSGQVVKSGDETLTLSGANSYTGGTLISGGTLVATSVEALGSGDVTDNAVLELNTGGTFDNAISGSGQVVKSGDKTLTLSGANSYTGGTTISGGTLVASNVNALGSGDIDNYASLQLNASGQFVTANLTTHDNATTAIGAGSALRGNTLTQEANSTLAVHLTDSNSGAIVTADHANLGGTLDITGIGNVAKSWTRDAYAYTLIDTDSAINSDFAQFTVAGMDAKQVDFLTVDGRVNAADDTRYDVTASLSWYADSDNAATNAHGTFTLSEQGHSFTLNTALTDVDATLNPDSATYWDGKSLIKRGAGTLILGAQNTYSGDTDVQEGALWLAETATIGSAGSAQAVNIAANAAFGGHNATVNGHVNNQGSLYFVDTFTVNGDVVNSSAMISGSDQPNNTLTIAGNYTGNDGHLYLNTQLGDDSSPTDKLIVTGDTAGSTTLHITNVNGLGAQTVNGIEVIEVGGQSDGDFRLYKGHVDINAWTYTLKQDGGDWYLRSESDDVPDDGGEVTPPDDGGEVTPPDDGGEVTPPDDGGEVTPPDDGGEVTPPDDGGDITPPDDDGDITPPDGGDVTPVAPQYRADIGVYLGNQWMARNLQMQTLYDREGSQYRSADGSIWMRFKAGKAESQAVNGNVDIDSDYSQFQLGGDILTWSDGAQSVTVGLMGSYINANTDSTGNRGADGSQFSANGSVDGYNLGLYATWFADAQSHRGAYIDSWYQYGVYNNSVDNDGLSASRYDSAAHAVSLETGYRYDIALSNRNTVSLTPQAQVTWQRYSADTVIDDGGTRISGQNDDSWTTRLGMRVDGKLYKESGRIQPFMEVNWLHASDNASATFGDTKVSQDLPNDRVEVKVGIQANVSERLSVYAQAAGQKGKNDYGDASFSLNMRYNW